MMMLGWRIRAWFHRRLWGHRPAYYLKSPSFWGGYEIGCHVCEKEAVKADADYERALRRRLERLGE